MSRSFGASLRMMAREAARAERARQQAQARQQAAAVRALRNRERQAKADAREAAQDYTSSRMEEAAELSGAVQERDEAISSLLARGLARNPAVDLLSHQTPFKPAKFDEAKWRSVMPEWATYSPNRPGFFARLLPGSAGRHRRRVEEANTRFEQAISVHQQCGAARTEAFEAYSAEEIARKAEVETANEAIRAAHQTLLTGEHAAVIKHFELVVDSSLDGDEDAVSAEIGYSQDSKHVVVDLNLPELSAVPEETTFRYVKAGDRIEATARPIAKRKATYAHLISQVALKCVDTVFRGAPSGIVDCLTLNGMLDTIDPATGQQVRVCLISVRVTADTFQSLSLGQVQPEHCLRSLKASVSRAPAELLPVKPLIELNMVDPRFVETMDVMSGLDSRTNLMDLTPTEFEGLITNLFGAMGLDTRQTRPSRDGGVDCVAFDPRPVFGGKVVIQAKRYKNTVGVSAVRDLFGTVQNEGASKGILVTTSGYGKAAYDFARGKPLELLDGSNLLHLLAEHAGLDAKIIMPDGWTDLPVHGE